MANVTTSIRIDADTKKTASELLNDLGLDLSSAVNIFLKQVILQGGLPFEIKYPQYKPEVIEAMEEAKKINKDPNAKKYTNVHEMFQEILEDGTES
jgi:DNA-damage-inducible protein J